MAIGVATCALRIRSRRWASRLLRLAVAWPRGDRGRGGGKKVNYETARVAVFEELRRALHFFFQGEGRGVLRAE